MKRANRDLREALFAAGRIRLARGPLFEETPGAFREGFDFGKIEGMMLGLAIGDALGNTSEGLLPEERRDLFGEIRDYLPNRRAGRRRVGLPSDDTQLAFWTLEQMLEDDGLIPERLARHFARGRIFGIGGTVSAFLANREAGLPWEECGPASAGNGALMRIAPVLIPHLRTGTTDLWVDTALAAMLTHNDPGSTAACLAFVRMLWTLLARKEPPVPEWWPAAFIEAARGLEGETRYRPRGGPLAERFEGPIWRMVAEQVPDAFARGLSVVEACDLWYSGAFLLETVPSVLYILMRHGHDPEEAVVRAVNDTEDNDTIAAVVGAAVGALHGRQGLPRRWIAGLTGRTAEADDGRVFDLLAEARKRWAP